MKNPEDLSLTSFVSIVTDFFFFLMCSLAIFVVLFVKFLLECFAEFLWSLREFGNFFIIFFNVYF